MQTELIEKIIHLPVAERIEIIERISRSLREDLREGNSNQISHEERKKAVDNLRGIAALKDKPAPSDKEIKEDYTNYLAEKYK
jgi:hypothetical protein